MKKFYITGSAPKKEKEKVRKIFERNLLEHNKYLYKYLSKEDKEIFKKYEIKKTKKEVKIIKGVNKISNDIIKELGGEIYDIPLENIHFLSDKGYFELNGTNKYSDRSDGIVYFEKQGILVRINYLRNKSLIYFISTLLHEILHLKGIFEVRFLKVGNTSNWFVIRNGISILSPYDYKNPNSKTYERFWGLHEAIITYQEKKSYSDILNLPILKKEKEWLESKEHIKLKEEKSKKTKYPIDEIIFIDKKNKENWSTYGHYWQRKIFDYVLEEIQKEFIEYKNKEEIFKEFLKAHFKRNHIRKVRELFEKTFGKYSFMVLGNIQSETSNVFLHLETLKKFREEQLKKKKRKRKRKIKI